MQAFQILVRPGEHVYRFALHAGGQTRVRKPREFDAGANRGLNALDKQGVDCVDFHVSNEKTTCFYTRFNAAFPVESRSLMLGRQRCY